jgi:polysaccharide chain length determinant protein (PEP-CTERM system associated)
MRADLRRVHAAPLPPPTDVRNLLEAPFRRPWLVVVPFVLVVAVAVAASFLVQAKYRSATLILIESETVPEAFVTRVATERRHRGDTLKQEILSRTRLERIIRELDPYPAETRRGTLSEVVERMRNAVTIGTRGDDAFTIEYVHNSPEKAMVVTNRLASLFIEEAAATRGAQVEGTSQFIQSQLEEARKELQLQEEAVRRYKQQHMGTLPEQLATNLAALNRIQLEQTSVGESLQAAQNRLSLLESQPRIVSDASPGPASDPETEIAGLRARLDALRGRYTDEHPEVAALLARIALLEKAPGRRGTTGAPGNAQAAQVRLEVESLRARRADLDRKAAEYQARVEQAPRGEQELAGLTRDFQRLNENYLALLSKKLDTQMAAKLEQRWMGDHFKVLDPASLPEAPFYPNRLLFLLGGVLAGLAAGVGLAVATEMVDRSVKTIAELEAVLPYPLLVSVPHIAVAGRAPSIRTS